MKTLLSEKRTQIYFPIELYRKIIKMAKEESRSMASIIREAVENYLEERKNIDWNNDPFFKTVGIMESGTSNLSKNHDRYLYNNLTKLSQPFSLMPGIKLLLK